MFTSKTSNNSTGFKFGANNLEVDVNFVSPSKDGSSPKQIIISIPDTYNKKIVWVPKQEGKVGPMPYNKYKFDNGVELSKGEQMTADQANEFEMNNFLTQIGKLEEAFGITEPTTGATLTEYIENFCKAANGKKVFLKMVYQDAPNANKDKYYLEISKERNGWIGNSELSVAPTALEVEHAAKAVAYNKQEPVAQLTSESKAEDLPF